MFRIQLGSQVEVDPEEINVTFNDVKGVCTNLNKTILYVFLYSDVIYIIYDVIINVKIEFFF